MEAVPVRRKTRTVHAGGVAIGGGAAISVQTMTKADVFDVEANLRQIRAAADAGCDLARAAVPSVESASAFAELAKQSPLPLVADTHFDWRVSLAAIDAGAAKLRINPGNMDRRGLGKVVAAARERGIPIRIGGNSGSVRRPGDGRGLPELLADEALSWAGEIESMGFSDIVLSLKTPDASSAVAANRLAAARSDYPLHLGVTAAGPREDSLLKSAVALGALLLDGIGDTIRLSFTGDPVEEVRAGRDLLRAAGLLRDRPEILSCPTCGRCRIGLGELVEEVKAGLSGVRKWMRVAVMGCEVNGPGEAGEADAGIASAGGTIRLFAKGRELGTVPREKAVAALLAEVEKIARE